MSVLTQRVLSHGYVPARGKTAKQVREQAVKDGILVDTQVPELARVGSEHKPPSLPGKPKASVTPDGSEADESNNN